MTKAYEAMAEARDPASTITAIPDRLTVDKMLILTIALGGMFLVRLSEQFASANIADIQSGVFATPDEASWILTAYTMASFAGIVMSGPLIRALGLGRYLVASSVVFTISAVGCAMGPALGPIIALRAMQGFVSGGFGPAAFAAVFMIAGAARLNLMATVLAFLLLFPTTAGPVIAGFIENAFGWRALFWFQACAGTLIALGSVAWLPRQAAVWSALKLDWTAVTMLSLALGLLTLVFSQGTRRFWFESDLIFWGSSACIGAFAGFMFLARFSPLPIMNPRLLFTRRFGVANGLNFVIRATLVVTSYLLPQFLIIVQGYRPLEIARLMLWATVSQLMALPMIWWFMHLFDARILMAIGFGLCSIAAALALDGTSLAAASQFRLTLVLFSVGQAIFLLPAVVVGTSSLQLSDLPTASLAFNITTVGGTVLGAGLVSHLITEREKFHSNILTESVSLYDSQDSDHIGKVAEYLTLRFADDAATTAKAVSVVASQVRREAWVLGFNDAFLVIAALLAISAIGVIAIGRSPPLTRAARASGG